MSASAFRIDIAPLLAPTLDAPPGGVSLEYDASFREFEALVNGKQDRQFDTAAEEPPWREIMERGAALLARSKDLRVALGVMRAASHLAGVGGFHAGLRLLLAVFDDYWDTLHPALDHDDEDASETGDPALRINALAALADPYTPFAGPATLLHDLRMAEICRVRGERVIVRDVLIAQGKLPVGEGETAVSLQHVQGVLADALREDPHALDEAFALPGAIQALANRMSERFGADRAPSIATMMSVAQTLLVMCRGVMSAASIASAETPVITTSPAAPPVTFTHGAAPATRADAVALLDAVCAFLERTEPANPAPLLIRRAISLMGKDFMEIMEDLAPDGLSQVHLIAGTRPS